MIFFWLYYKIYVEKLENRRIQNNCFKNKIPQKIRLKDKSEAKNVEKSKERFTMSRKEKIISISAIAFLLAAVVTLVVILSCLEPLLTEPKVKQRELEFEYFDTVTQVLDYSGASDAEFDKYCASVAEVFLRYHKLCDIYNEYEGTVNLKNVNDAKGEAVAIGEELFELLEYSVRMYELTEGTLNIAMGALLRVWHEYRSAADENPFDESDNTLPSAEELEEAAKHCDISKIYLDRSNFTVTLLDPEMSLDLGAIAKGYAAERAAELLENMGAGGVVINAGGNIRMIGERLSGIGWEVGIKNPENPHDVIKTLTLSDTSAVTSGGYERYFTVDGRKYHHIIDAKTLYPADYHASVTVVHPDSGLADCLSTALFNCDKQTGASIIENIKNAGLGEVTVEYIDKRQTVK